ncbi:MULTISPECIES: type III secretion system effector XopAV [Xanthomonas]|uniref:Uncharacterized protein n=1 Tax=Xanthomonas hortorum pv. gardneri TaxID=2754056 RepID=A0A6V7E7K6_9XANT|nr:MULTISPECIES: type III secretion system effector XopAV [Xanthomonas]APP79819.1 hypothetical protein BJD10_08965 [Xanthomonas hortorum pv. gardneri]EGD20376.1 hypothetical protein XGA_0947 [Xanthomonas hortorum ATCC 19865]KLA99179.1 hypothetical protein SM18210_16720 [Xanthomonas hortorum pv. gardneri]KLA99761.1 hypothetical protein SM17710_08935 [Xanthomonas hortorum pv. gardneri]KLB01156.1 hypothetical protein SM19410_03675 [Xanthomonas hortorum pv. gardneri]
MGSFPVSSVAREAVRHDQREAQAPREVGYSSQRGDPQANPQLKQDLSRAPVRAARLKAPRVPIGVHIANTGLQAARFATSAVAGPAEAAVLDVVHAPAAAAYEYAKGEVSWKKNAGVTLAPALAYAVVMGTLSAVQYLANRYLQAQSQTSVSKADRAKELGVTEACLDAAVAMVNKGEVAGPGGEMTEEEAAALAADLQNLATADRSRLPPELWRAASGVGDDACALVTRLLLAARARASAEASASYGS